MKQGTIDNEQLTITSPLKDEYPRNRKILAFFLLKREALRRQFPYVGEPANRTALSWWFPQGESAVEV
jgi:hypothetical protein